MKSVHGLWNSDMADEGNQAGSNEGNWWGKFVSRRMTPGWQIPLLLTLSIGAITWLHYNTSTERVLLHEIYQRLYYVPIIYAAYRYGVAAALAASIFSAILYAPHIFMHWEKHYVYQLNQNAEILMFQVIAVVTGLLATAEKRERRLYESTARELRQAYGELKQAYDQLIRADRLASLGEVSAGIVHEIRTPLASIKGAVEILETPTASERTKTEFLRIIHREVDRLNRLVVEFLQFARPSQPQKLPTDINELAQSVVLLCQKQAAKGNVDIRTRFEEALPLVFVDSEQVKQVLLNIVINSIQAMPDGGLLELTIRQKNGNVEVLVKDEGRGIDALHLEKVFDPFFTTKQNGTGLGLSIAYRLVKQNGGDIEVSNGPGAGCLFKLTFPGGNEDLAVSLNRKADSYEENPFG